MSIRNYTPIGVGVFFLICAATYYTRVVPVAPVAIISFAALTGLAFQLEDHKIPRMIRELFAALHDDRTHHVH